jgi:hypothetical protein
VDDARRGRRVVEVEWIGGTCLLKVPAVSFDSCVPGEMEEVGVR